MVHPLMRQSPSSSAQQSSSKDPDADPEQISSRIIEMLPRLHVLVIGPGLGRDPLMQATVAKVMTAAREKGIPLVLDADALMIVQKDPGLVRGYAGAVLTPNIMEFGRLCKAFDIDPEAAMKEAGGEGEEDEKSETAKIEALARSLDGVTIVQKGGRDYISNGRTPTLVSDLEGGKKRSGGQGDTLTGAIATFLGWRKAYLDGLWEETAASGSRKRLSEEETIGLAAFGGSAITRVSLRPWIRALPGTVIRAKAINCCKGRRGSGQTGNGR
jgi:ATP-dependent NAD(P)H-hydrate dehydratase